MAVRTNVVCGVIVYPTINRAERFHDGFKLIILIKIRKFPPQISPLELQGISNPLLGFSGGRGCVFDKVAVSS